MTRHQPPVIIGAGPAGLTAAYELARRGLPVVVFEQSDQVGGLAKTVQYKGFRFDLGGHRFFTKVPVIQELWRSVLGPDFLRRPRLSRIYYRGKFFQYPLKPFEAMLDLGVATSTAVVFSYFRTSLFPIQPEVSFADWVSNRFGRHLYRIFFKSYTEKVWGIPGDSIGAQWAAQRIKGLSLRTALSHALFGDRTTSKRRIKTLIAEFEYPRLGPGMMWEAFASRIEEYGGRVHLNSRVTRVLHSENRVLEVHVDRADGPIVQPVSHLISTSPLKHLFHALDPAPPNEALDAVDQLQHRAFITVALVVTGTEVFPDNWIYIHDEAVKVGRIQNYNNWSPDMVPRPGCTCLGLEYFCAEGDGLWRTSDEDLIELAKKEIVTIGLTTREAVVDAAVVRMPDAYPVYDDGFQERLITARRYLSRFENLQTIGRNGLHQYNNQDHSMLTAILAVKNLLEEDHDLWSVNTDDSYHEELVLDESPT